MTLAAENVENALLVTLNPGAADDVLEALSRDDEILVRLLAREVLGLRRRAVATEFGASQELLEP
jgi:hypothetical protein